MIVKGVSFSSDRKLSRCEQQYDYRYAQKLEKKIKKPGLYKGDWGHQLLESHYRTGDFIPLWNSLVENKWDKLFDEEKEEYGVDFPWRIKSLMDHYVEYWRAQDSKWTILHLEKDFQLMTKAGFPVRWKSDLIVSEELPGSNVRRIKSHNNKRNILVETKFKKAIPDSSERILQPQVHAYAFLSGKVGIPIDSIMWNYIRTEDVPRPAINKDGSMSVRKLNTDRRGYLTSFNEASIKPYNFSDPDEIINFNSYINNLPETLSLERVTNTPNMKLGEDFVRQWVERARRAQKIKTPLRTWNRDCKWDCDFYNLCQVDMIGKVDRNLVILRDYIRRDEVKEELK